MHTSSTHNGLTESQRTKLFNRIDKIKPVLELDGEWTVHDTPHDVRDIVLILKQEGAVDRLRRIVKSYTREHDRFGKNQGSSTVAVYEWRTGPKETLQTYLEERNELPCGHRAHIYNPRGIDGYSCRHCVENDKQPVYSKQEVKEAL